MAELTAEKPKIWVRITKNPFTGKNVVTYVDQYGHARQSALKGK